MNNKKQKGFTLIELLVVIAIVAVLAIVVVLALNPAEMLRQSRDSNRLSDMSTLKSAVLLYIQDNGGTNLSLGTSTQCYISLASGSAFATVASSTGSWTAPTTTANGASCANWMATAGTGSGSTTLSNSRVTTGSGWLPVNFSGVSGGAPFAQEPIDAVNTGGNSSCSGTSPTLSNCPFFYSYLTNGSQFKLATFMESARYSHGGTGDVESTTVNGGNNPYVFEGGTNPTL